MRTVGIIAEYDPFHNGHAYHIQKTRELCAADGIVCVMSGDYVQRGGIAVTDKFERTAAALKNGADLVIELPAAYALGSAERFARRGVGLLDMLGCTDMLSFGSESGDAELLCAAAAAAENADKEKLSEYMSKGLSYPSALTKALSGSDERMLTALASPNDILGIEYIRAIKRSNSRIKPFAVKRNGARHGEKGGGTFRSAGEIREMLSEGLDVSGFLPYNIGETTDIKRLEVAVLAKLRTLTAEDFAKLPDISNGAENRIYRAVRESASLEELYASIKSKRCTLSWVKRTVMCAFIGITRKSAEEPPAYIRVLGMNGRGREILAASSCSVPIDTSLFALSEKSPAAARQATLQSAARDIYALAFSRKRPCGGDLTAKPVILP